MSELLFLSEQDVEDALDLDALTRAMGEAFASISRGSVDVPDRISAAAPSGILLAMPGYVAGIGLATKLVSLYPGNPSDGLPSHQGILVFFDAATGTPIAVMGAERLTQARTAAGSALAADVLAREDASTLAIIGAGSQGVGHLEALAGIRSWGEIRIWNRTDAKARSLASRDDRAVVVDSVGMALTGADVIALCTHTDEPLFQAADVEAGAHISSVGIGREIPADLLRSSTVCVEWRGAAEAAPPAGAADLSDLSGDDVVELGAIVTGDAPGRQSEDQVTIYKSVGHSAEDCAAARVVIDRARSIGVGTSLEL